MTLDEIFPSGRGDGRKFRLKVWPCADDWFQPFYRDKDGDWHGLTDEGRSSYYPGDEFGEFGEFGENWQEWHPPKKKVTKWLWAKADGEINTVFSCAPTRKKKYSEITSTLQSEVYFDIKLEWSATDFDA